MTIIAAYADPCFVLCLMMIPALDHGCRARRLSWVCEVFGPEGAADCWTPVSDVTWAVMLPLPVSGWRTK